MFHITSSLFGGLAAVTAWALVAPSFDQTAKANLALDNHAHVNRIMKGDRLPTATVVRSDRDGRVLFQTEPFSNVTAVSKGDTPRSAPTPVVVPRKLEAAPAIPVGCDPVASPIAEPALARVTGRCLS